MKNSVSFMTENNYSEHDEHELDAANRFKEKVLVSIDQNKHLECIGYYVSDLNFTKLLVQVRYIYRNTLSHI